MTNPLAALLLSAVFAVRALADPKEDVRAAIQALRDASGFAWITTARVNVREYPDYKRPDDLGEPASVVEVEGRSDQSGFIQVTLPPSKTTVEVPVTALIKSSVEALADTPIGWMTRQEMRDSPRQRETAKVGDKTVRLSRFFAAATKATNVEPPLEELDALVNGIESYEETDAGIVGHLRRVDAELLQERNSSGGGASGATSGTILFKLNNGVLSAYAVKLVTEIPRVDREPIKSITRWGMSFTSVGSVSVNVPYEAKQRFEKMREER